MQTVIPSNESNTEAAETMARKQAAAEFIANAEREVQWCAKLQFGEYSAGWRVVGLGYVGGQLSRITLDASMPEDSAEPVTLAQAAELLADFDTVEEISLCSIHYGSEWSRLHRDIAKALAAAA